MVPGNTTLKLLQDIHYLIEQMLTLNMGWRYQERQTRWRKNSFYNNILKIAAVIVCIILLIILYKKWH